MVGGEGTTTVVGAGWPMVATLDNSRVDMLCQVTPKRPAASTAAATPMVVEVRRLIGGEAYRPPPGPGTRPSGRG